MLLMDSIHVTLRASNPKWNLIMMPLLTHSRTFDFKLSDIKRWSSSVICELIEAPVEHALETGVRMQVESVFGQ